MISEGTTQHLRALHLGGRGHHRLIEADSEHSGSILEWVPNQWLDPGKPASLTAGQTKRTNKRWTEPPIVVKPAVMYSKLSPSERHVTTVILYSTRQKEL